MDNSVKKRRDKRAIWMVLKSTRKFKSGGHLQEIFDLPHSLYAITSSMSVEVREREITFFALCLLVFSRFFPAEFIIDTVC